MTVYAIVLTVLVIVFVVWCYVGIKFVDKVEEATKECRACGQKIS